MTHNQLFIAGLIFVAALVAWLNWRDRRAGQHKKERMRRHIMGVCRGDGER